MKIERDKLLVIRDQRLSALDNVADECDKKIALLRRVMAPCIHYTVRMPSTVANKMNTVYKFP